MNHVNKRLGNIDIPVNQQGNGYKVWYSNVVSSMEDKRVGYHPLAVSRR